MHEYWKFFAGLGLFLLGMYFLEHALKQLTGTAFKRFLREHTRHPAEAIVVGMVVTAILQSSSLVTLMLLALTGAGIITLRNALGVVIGANLGTTFTGWIVTTLGFKLNFDQLALPLVGLGCIGFVFVDGERRLHHWFSLVLGFGFLFMGLGFMKDSAAGLAGLVDVQVLASYGLPVFLLFGFILTAIIQSSSASMMIVLSAVHAGIIDLPMAAAVIIGSDLGSTMTTVLGAMKGSAEKRRVALAHFLFNLITNMLALVMIFPLLDFITNVAGIQDPLYGTVAFHSIFNLLGIVIFYPMMGRFATFLEGCFVEVEVHAARYLHRVPMQETDTFVEALQKDNDLLLRYAVQFNLRSAVIAVPAAHATFPIMQSDELRNWPGEVAAYQWIKDLQGEILDACVAVQQQPLDAGQSLQVAQVIAAARAAVHSVKSIKDVLPNLREFAGDAEESVQNYLQVMLGDMKTYYQQVMICLQSKDPQLVAQAAEKLRTLSDTSYDRLWHTLVVVMRGRRVSDAGVATLNSMNREFYSSGKSMAEAIASLPQIPDKVGISTHPEATL